MKRTFPIFAAVAIVILLFAGVYQILHAQGATLDALNLPEDGTSIIQKVFEALKRALRAIGNWFTGIGVDIGRLIRLFGEFIVLLFESLAKLARFIFAWIGGAVGD